jgi:hypothetical protein
MAINQSSERLPVQFAVLRLHNTSAPTFCYLLLINTQAESIIMFFTKSLLMSGLVLATQLTAVTAGTQPACNNGVLFPGTNCRQECLTDRPGGDYQKINYLSLSKDEGFKACARACSADSQCKAAHYRMDNRFCYLKQTVNRAQGDGNVNGVVCRAGCMQGELIPGTTCRQECNMDRPGNDIDRLRVSPNNPLQACAQACIDNPRCLTAQFRR